MPRAPCVRNSEKVAKHYVLEFLPGATHFTTASVTLARHNDKKNPTTLTTVPTTTICIKTFYPVYCASFPFEVPCIRHTPREQAQVCKPVDTLLAAAEHNQKHFVVSGDEALRVLDKL